MRHLRSLREAGINHARSLRLALLSTALAAVLAPAALHADSPLMPLPGGGGGPNIVIADCSGDGGAEPSPCPVYYKSPSIYIRHNQDGLTPGNDFMMYPIPGQVNWVYVKLKNIGSGTLNNGKVYLYFSKAGTGFTWPSSWINNYINGVAYGDEIGWVSVSNIAPGGTVTVEIPWGNVPDPNDYNDSEADHFCLMARFVSSEDPMTFPEGSNAGTNVRNNNNSTQCNITVMRRPDPRAALDIHNIDDRLVPTRLNFDVDDKDEANGDHALDHVQIKVDLGDELYTSWTNAGSEGEGITDNGDNTITIEEPHAWIRGIDLPPASTNTIHVEIDYGNTQPSDEIYHWAITQYEDQGPEDADDIMIGGESYDIWMSEDAPLKRNITERANLAAALELSAYPNPLSNTTAIGFTLPNSGQISLSIYDATGRLVRTLLSNAERNAGRHELSWDGTSADGGAVPAGTYFYRLSTPMGTTERQLKVVQ